MPVSISSAFDAGAIEVVRAEVAHEIDLRLRADSHADFSQWFYFRVHGVQGQRCRLRFLNAGQATYPDGWKDYQAVASYDREHWFRVPTSFDGEVLTIAHTPRHDSIYYAYFEPYSWERHLGLLARAQLSPLARLVHLGCTADGRDLDMVTVSAAVGESVATRRQIWVIARQHPGETMAEWFAEGVLEALLGSSQKTEKIVR